MGVLAEQGYLLIALTLLKMLQQKQRLIQGHLIATPTKEVLEAQQVAEALAVVPQQAQVASVVRAVALPELVALAAAVSAGLVALVLEPGARAARHKSAHQKLSNATASMSKPVT